MPVSILSSEEKADAFRALEDKRRQWESDYTPLRPPKDFGTKLLGGGWTKANRLKPFDRVQTVALSKRAKAFCENQFRPTSFSLDYHTEVWAASLAWHWCKRAQYFLDVADGQADFCYLQREIDAAPQFGGVAEMLPDLPPSHPARKAARELDRLVPD